MSAISGISGTASADLGMPDWRARRPSPEPASPGRALVAAAAPRSRAVSLPLTGRPSAPFLAHLIATDQDLPQTRARRRAEPSDALAAYAARPAMAKPVRIWSI